MLTLKSAACGFVSDVDMRDKLTTFILKNPPDLSRRRTKPWLMRSKIKEAQDEERQDQAAQDDDDAVQWQTDTSLEAAKKRIQEQQYVECCYC
ncbi:hypothetical protein M0R45_003479 [Rubus argutus]|uniref:Uncharacterized protein n=1 Tax=Rubus argutus TaxID=59490 RepID=A0AAW1YF78_RUBAR